MKHIHAELMLQYAQDAMETDTPWERWEYLNTHGFWETFDSNPYWFMLTQCRRKKETIVINGIEVPKPVSVKLNYGDEYYVAGTSSRGCQDPLEWKNDDLDNFWLEKGLIHLDEQSATTHVKALLSFTTKDTDE